ncbi:TPA: ORF6N domain-containing protein [Yersinia enterocolitica]|uniref:ORF6N domain-containing protein n=2 Tax=Yersinia TaxID=629 RepID=A0AAD2V150_YEREN|nr:MULTISPECIES: ORF6N domain-containing protein [Yersinia]EKN3562505.1 ORF6N domain-containing protein [Yersinia enterocolitica]EKN3634499.1 ORF6N domain-containing protein [Yersinia enterocolitica]EKN3981841.1 ORF6N domain-containing protein [Yersinia enterocolitica]EKN4810905.1 ORF6N domain-containing protein [Yersinia enterocolitica]EKN6065506.1 ORF6N domain-containing protein [Yersinia enterocolitica]
MNKKTELALIEAKDLQIIEYRGQRVATTEQLAAGYGTTVIRIQQNHHENKSRFVEGKHFFKVVGTELNNLRLVLSELQISPKTRSLMLWTERGAANHAKMLETDQAWEYYNDLTEFYFTRRNALPATVDQSSVGRKQLALMVLEAEEKIEALGLHNQELAIAVDSLEKHFAKGMTIPSFCKCLNGVNTSKVMWWAFERDWIFNEQRDPEKDPRWRVASYARDKYLTEEETEIKPHGKEPFRKKTPVLLEKGCHRIYALYLKGELPMKQTWNGDFSHDKAVYTPEAK